MHVSARFIAVYLCCIYYFTNVLDVCGISCRQATSNCHLRLGCRNALFNFGRYCSDQLLSSTTCNPICLEVLLSLLTTEDKAGAALMDCSCDGDRHCKRQRRAVAKCRDTVIPALDTVDDPKIVVKCSLAKLLCEADTSCYKAICYYSDLCMDMFEGKKCSNECNNSLSILYRQKRAQKLNNCICDEQSNREYNCEVVRKNTMSLCLGVGPSPTKNTQLSRNKSSRNNFTGLNYWILLFMCCFSVRRTRWCF